MKVKFNNKPCISCNILPICNGSCSQHALDLLGKEYCIHGFNENIKLEIVKNKLKYILG
jgi:uncharacterized protein